MHVISSPDPGPTPIRIPSEWSDNDLVTFEDFCTLMRLPQRTVRDWRRRRVGPRWNKIAGTGRLYVTVGQLRRIINPKHNPEGAEE